MFDDIRYAMRRLLKTPKFSALTIFVMTTGLSLCIFMVGFLQSTLLAPLPFEHGEKVRKVTTVVDGVIYDGATLRLHEFEELREKQQIFSQIDAYKILGVNLSTSDKVMRYETHYVTPTFFSMSDGHATLGRLFEPMDLEKGHDNVAVLSYVLWQELYAGNEQIIGEKLRINGENYTVIGVTSQGYRFPGSAKLYLPFTDTTHGVKRENSPYVAVHGLLRDSVSDAQAMTFIQQFFTELKEQYPELNSNIQGYIWTYQDEMVGNGGEGILTTMMISVALILLLACINVGNLLLSRAIEQNKEIAIRSALGAPRATLIKQMMWESVIICCVSGLFSILIAGFTVNLSVQYFSTGMPIEAPYYWHENMTSDTLFAAVAICIATIFVTGFLPAWRASRTDINAVLRDGTRGAQSKGTGRLSKIIVISEVALSCALILVSVSMVNAVGELEKADYGVASKGYLTARVGLDPNRYATTESRIQYYENLKDLLKQDPNVTGVAYASSLPHTWGYLTNFALEQFDYGKEPNYPSANLNLVDTEFNETLDLTLVEGRWFTPQDNETSPMVAVVSQNFVDKYYPNESPIGKRFVWVDEDDAPWITIIGVSENVIFGQPVEGNKIRSSVFVPYKQSPRRNMLLAITSNGDPDLLRSSLNRAALQLDKDTPAYSVKAVEVAIAERIGGMNFVSRIFLSFAIASMVLAFSGIYGVMANSIAQKRQEVGVRRALGASDSDVLRHFTIKGMKQLSIGLLVGLPAGFGLVTLMAQAGIASGSVAIFIAVPTLILLVVVCAVYFPVKHSLAFEPAVALRDE
ncbi:ABC transporter permease [Pseudoalteromonas xiamenensis]